MRIVRRQQDHVPSRQRGVARPLVAAWPTAILLVAGCGSIGGQTGEGERGPPRCEQKDPIGLRVDERTPLGFSGDEVLGFVAARHEFDASWPASADEASGVEPRLARLTLTLEPRTDEVRFVESTLDGQSLPDCRSWMELDVRVSLALDNDQGSWSFSFDGVVAASSVLLARMNAELDASTIAGMAQATPKADEELARLRIDAWLSELGASGTLKAIFKRHVPAPDPEPGEDDDGPTASAYTAERHTTLARFPLENPCGRWDDPSGFVEYVDRHPVPTDVAPFGDLASRVADSLTSDQQPLTWSSGASTVLSLSNESSAAVACLRERCVLPCSGLFIPGEVRPMNETRFELPLSLSARTSDERWQGTFEVAGTAYVDPLGRILHAALVHYDDIPNTQANDMRSGFAGIEVGTSLDLKLEIRASRDSGQAQPAGEVLLYAPDGMAPRECQGQQPCLHTPNDLRLVVERGTW